MIEAGKNALEYKDYASAIKYFNNVIENRPKIHEAIFYRGKTKYYLGDYIGSEMDLSEVLNLNPYYYDAYELRGIIRIHLQKYLDAAEDFSNSTTYKSDDEEIWHKWVSCLLEAGKYEKADSISDQIISHWPSSCKAYNLKARAQYFLSNPRLSEQLVDKSLSIDPFNMDGLLFKASLLFMRESWKESELYFSKYLYVDPKNSDVLTYKGLCCLGEGDYNEGLTNLTQSISLSPTNILSLYNHAILSYSLGHIQECLNDLKDILRLFPNEKRAKKLYDIIISNKDKHKSHINFSLHTIDTLSDTTSFVPFSYVIYKNYPFANSQIVKTSGISSIDTQNMYSFLPPHNLTEYQIEAYKSPPSFKQGYESLLMKDYMSAISSFTGCISESPLISESYYNRAYAYSQINKYDKSINDLNKAIELNKHYAEAYYNRGLLYMRQNRLEEAKKDFSKAGELGIEFAYSIINELSF